MSEKPDYIESDVIDLRQILEVLKKWRRVIVLITLLAVFTSAIMSYYIIDPVYEAKSMLLVTMPAANQQSAALQNGGDLESVINTMSRMPYMTMNTYVSQLTSDTMYQRVVDRLKLDEQGYTAKNLAGMIKAEVAKDNNIIELKVQHTDPRLAADVANALGEVYLEYLSERSQQQMTRSTDFLQERKEETDKQLNELSEKYRVFNSDAQSVEYLQKQFTGITDDLNKYQTSVDMGYTEARQLEAGVASLNTKLANTPETVTTNKASQDGTGVLATEEMNPIYVSLSEKLNEKEAELAEKTVSLESMNATTERLRSQLAALQTTLSAKQIKQHQMQNEITRLEETQNMLAQKITQTQIASSIDMGKTNINIASPALVPANPIKPNKQLNIAVALVLGLMVAVGLAFVLEFMDNTIKGLDDVQKHLGLAVVGTIPVYNGAGKKTGRGLFASEKHSLPVFSSLDSRSPFAEAFRTLRTNLSFAGVDKHYRTILVTSTVPSEGKSCSIANLGVVMAQAGQKVLIIDCDLRKPVQHNNFNLNNTIGVTNCLVNDLELARAVQNTGAEGLDVLTSGPIPPNPAELIASNKMAVLINAARDAYDIVLVDSPPVLTVTDASLLATMVDGVLLVVKTASSKIEMVQGTKSVLDNANAKIIGVVLNQVDVNSSNYYYHYYKYSKDDKEKTTPRVA